jgi:hypothetical protein
MRKRTHTRADRKAGRINSGARNLPFASSVHMVLAGRLRHPANGRLPEHIRAAARTVAPREDVNGPPAASSEPVDLIGHTGDLCAQSTVIARKIRRSEEVRALT